MEAEELDALIEIEHAFRYVMQAKVLFMPAIDVVRGQPLGGQLLLERFADPGCDMEQGKKSGRVQAAAMSQAGADDVIVVGSDGFQHVEQRDRVLQHAIGPS